jgi:superfamily II DNA or RNA helicase
MNNTYLNKRGYVIKKNTLTSKKIKEITDILTVKPNIPSDYGQVINTFKVYLENDNKLYIPKFFGISEFGLPLNNKVPDGSDIDLEFKFKLRDNQLIPAKKCIDAYKEKGGGILSLGCGYGKTILALYLICKLKKKTLVIVHKEFLMNQWIERIESSIPDANIGIIQQDKYDVKGKDIVIAMLQSISMKEYNFDAFYCFNHVIIDECHRIPSQVFSRALQKINAKYMLGLSATPNRKDGLTKILKWYIGDIIYSSEKKNENQVLVNRYFIISNNNNYNNEIIDFRSRPCMPKMINNITEYVERTNIIINLIKEIIIIKNRKILLLSDRRNHLKEIENIIINNSICSIGYYVGGMKKKDLKESESKTLILGTFSMANEGLDIEDLNCLILASPKSDIIQSCGRIMRKKHEFEPLIIDIVDNFSLFGRQSDKRLKYYKKSNYLINDYDVNDIDKIYEFKKTHILKKPIINNNVIIKKNNNNCLF